MNTDRKNFIEKLRSLSDPIKRRILFVATIISMVIVVGFWLVYFNTIVPSVNPAPAPATAPTTSSGNIFNSFADAASSFWQAIRDGIHGLISTMGNSRQYYVSPK